MNATDIKWTQAITAQGMCLRHDKKLTITIEVPREGDTHFVIWRCESTIKTPCSPMNWATELDHSGLLPV
jgi:serine protease inhibitor ecotin